MTALHRRTLLGAALATGFATAGLGAIAAPAAAGRPTRDWGPVAGDVRAELRDTWRSYRRYAWGHDHLLPVSTGFSEFFDDAHPVGLSIVEALDTLYLMGLDQELAQGVGWIRDSGWSWCSAAAATATGPSGR